MSFMAEMDYICLLKKWVGGRAAAKSREMRVQHSFHKASFRVRVCATAPNPLQRLLAD